MNYILLVSHGTIARAMHETLNVFFVGCRRDLLHVCMEEGMGPEEYTENVRSVLSVIKPGDHLIVLADLLGGSPLTYASYAVSQAGLLEHTDFLCGMNLPLILDLMDRSRNACTCLNDPRFLQEAQKTIRPFRLMPLSNEQTAESI